MHLIYKITDEDIGKEFIGLNNPRTRLGARGIVIRDDGKIAVFNKINKNEFKLPGGGIEDAELPSIAFKREVLEETGCIVEIVEELGIIEECISYNNFKQTSYVFVGKVIEDTKKLNVTQKEQNEGARLLWTTPENALELIKSCFDIVKGSDYDSVYASKFMVKRDSTILEYYINKK